MNNCTRKLRNDSRNTVGLLFLVFVACCGGTSNTTAGGATPWTAGNAGKGVATAGIQTPPAPLAGTPAAAAGTPMPPPSAGTQPAPGAGSGVAGIAGVGGAPGAVGQAGGIAGTGMPPPPPVPDLPPTAVTPRPQQIAYQEQEVIGFIHFGVNTYSGREWGTGQENPASFNPSQLDARQWVQVAEAGGLGTLILTAKHHDGFCLWSTKTTEHSVKASPWQGGAGDVAAELSRACAQSSVKFGFYLSPWDMHAPSYGTDAYNQFYLRQLEELLTNYGPVAEVWLDGAKGKNAPNMKYDFPAYFAMMRRLQPNAVILSPYPPDVRWIGNESGDAPSTCWSTYDRLRFFSTEQAATDYRGRGDPDGPHWLPGECDVSIRPGWFYHAAEDSKVKSAQQLVDLYYRCVGHNATLLINLPPDRRGLIHDIDATNLREFRSILDESFKTNLALGAKLSATNVRGGHARFAPVTTLDGDLTTYWATDDGTRDAKLTLELAQEQLFDRIMFQEPIRLGQRIEHFTIEAEQAGQWTPLAQGTTIGYKRLVRVSATRARKLRFSFRTKRTALAVASLGLFKASGRELPLRPRR